MFLKYDDLAGAAVIFYMYVSYSQFLDYMYYMYMWFPVLYLTNLISNWSPHKKTAPWTLVLNSLMHLHILEQDPDSNTKSSIAMSLR